MKKLEEKAREGRINENASIRDRQSAIINAPIEKVWDILIDINDWPNWCEEIKSANCDKVQAGAEFDWTIKHSRLHSRFQIVDSPTLLTWTGKSAMIKAIFVWNLEASDQQTIVTVEESVEGMLVPVFSNHSKLHDILIDWLQSLKARAEK